MMQCGARVDDERQVRSGVGNERDKAVYSGGVRSGGEGKETNLQGQARAGLSFKRRFDVCAPASHTRDGAGVRRVPDWDLIERAPSGSLQLGDTSDGTAG